MSVDETVHPDRTEERPTMTLGQRFRQPQTLFSFLFAVLIVVFLFRRVDIDPAEVWQRLRSANVFLFALGLLAFYTGFLVRVVRWRRMLKIAGVHRLPEVDKLPSNAGLLEIMLLAWFANCVVPAKLGDVYRGFLLKRRSNAPLTTSMGTIAAERLIDLVVLVILLVTSGLVVFGRHFPSGTRTVVIYGGATVLVGLVVVAVIGVFRTHLLGLLPARLAAPVNRIQKGLFENLKNPWRSAGYSVGIWALEGTRVFFVAWSLDAMLPPDTSLFIALVGSLAAVSPITPAGLGVVEAVLISVLTFVGAGDDTAAAITILDRVISYWSLIIVGLPLYILHIRRDVASAVTDRTSSA
jgi:uncharacterized membrane protein YbhN (UPF0104 family)